MRGFLLCAALAALSSGAAAAGNTEDEDDICVGGLRFYTPTIEEIRDLPRTPVPATFRAAVDDNGDCLTWVALDETLVRLHVEHGDEKSASAALAFLEWISLDGLPQTRGEMRSAARVRSAALAELQELEAALDAAQGDKAQREAFERYVETDRALFAAAPPPEEGFYREAGLFAQSAEFYRSAALLKRADALFARGESAAAETRASAGKALPSLETGRLRREAETRADLEERLAALKARVTRAPGDIERAHQLVLRNYSPLYALDADYAERSLDSVCDSDVSEHRATFEGPDYRGMCREPENLHRNGQNFWRRLSIVEMLMAADSGNFRTMTDAEILAALGQESDPIPSPFTRRKKGEAPRQASKMTSDMTAASIRSRSNFKKLARRYLLTKDEHHPWVNADLIDHLGLEALDAAELLPRTAPAEFASYYSAYEFHDDLKDALRLMAPHEHPALWRRLAEAWLATSDQIDADRDSAEEAEYQFVKANLERLRCAPFCE